MSVSDPYLWAGSPTRDEIEGVMRQYCGPCPWEIMARMIHRLAEGEECRQQDLLQALGKSRGGTSGRPIRELLTAGLVEAVDAQIRSGRKTRMLRFTDRGQALAVALGVPPRNGLPALLKRHQSPMQVLLVLEARDVLRGWGYPQVDLWAHRFYTPLGRDCRPDIVARTPQWREVFVEVEVRPPWARSANTYPRGRVQKWSIFHEVNGGALYVLTPSPSRERALVHEIIMWYQITREPVTLFSANVTYPGRDWDQHVFR